MDDSNLEFFIALLGTGLEQIGSSLAVPVVAGSLIGIIISKIVRPHESALASVIIGILGAIAGGMIFDIAGSGEHSYALVSTPLIIGSVSGAMFTTTLLNAVQHRIGTAPNIKP